MTTPDHDLLVALRAADPAAGVALSPGAAAAAVRRVHPGRAPRRRWLLWTGAVVAALAIGVPAGAVATGFAARTGWFGSPNPGGAPGEVSGTESDGTEWLDLGAADLPDVVASLYPEDLPLAPGITREGLTARVTASVSQLEGLAQETLVRHTYEYEAYRDWIGAWITAHEAGDVPPQERAAAVLIEAADWPAMVATDGGGITDVMRAYAARIATGDADAAQSLAQVENAPQWDGVDRSALSEEIYDEVREAGR